MATSEQQLLDLIATLPDEMREAFYTDAARRIQAVEKPAESMPDVVAWIEDNCYLYDTGEPMRLYECQIRPLRKALERDAEGNYRYALVLWSWIKKSAKTSLIAALVDYIASNKPRASIKLIANDLEQADSRVAHYLRENIKIAQRQGKRRGIKITPSGFKIEYPNGSIVRCVPIDPNGEAGGNDDLLVFSELHGWKSTAHRRMWSEMTLSPNKWGHSQRWIDTYAGHTGESPVLEMVYDTAITNGRQLWDDLEVYENAAARMLGVWVTKKMFPWQTSAAGQEYYAAEAQTLHPNEYRRMHENEWVSSSESFIPIELWDSCKVQADQFPPMFEVDPSYIRNGKPLVKNTKVMVAGVDAAVTHDCFGIVSVTKHEHPEGGYFYAVRGVRKWTPPKGGMINLAEPEAAMVQIQKDAPASVCFAFDPKEMMEMSQRLRNHHSLWMKQYDQGKDRNLGDKMLWDLIAGRRIIHDGNLDLREHIQNANAETTDGKFRIVKRSEALRIDLAVCTAMAVYTASKLNI